MHAEDEAATEDTQTEKDKELSKEQKEDKELSIKGPSREQAGSMQQAGGFYRWSRQERWLLRLRPWSICLLGRTWEVSMVWRRVRMVEVSGEGVVVGRILGARGIDRREEVREEREVAREEREEESKEEGVDGIHMEVTPTAPGYLGCRSLTPSWRGERQGVGGLPGRAGLSDSRGKLGTGGGSRAFTGRGKRSLVRVLSSSLVLKAIRLSSSLAVSSSLESGE